MSKELDYLAEHIRHLILEVDTLGYVFNEIAETYLDGYAENETANNPIRKLSNTLNAINTAKEAVIKTLISEKILNPYFRKSLQMLAMMDTLKDGENAFVEFVKKHVKD